MNMNEYRVIGVMSGTSLDGVDLVYVKFHFEERWVFNLIYSETVPYDDYWMKKLKGLVSLEIETLKLLDKTYTKHLSQTILGFIRKYKIEDIDAICSHGHTALHRPENRLTYQIGNLPEIASLLNNKVVCDFRVQDVQLEGQGAPLVPLGDQLLFCEYDYCLNLGGFANISTDMNNNRIAYDICPVNIVLNHYVSALGFHYDKDGKIAASGSLNKDLLLQLNSLDFYKQSYPKSLGLEWVKAAVFKLIDAFNLEVADVLHTSCEHIAIQICNELNKTSNAKVLVTGGGAYNRYLMQRLKFYSNNDLVIPENEVVEFKEAIIFAFLGILKLRGEINCLKSVTGAKQNHSTGIIYQP
ncbi:MAG: anhydro-N-acetylmuramic acid kinase [Jejuia sp.]